jgi:hypothetical protein
MRPDRSTRSLNITPSRPAAPAAFAPCPARLFDSREIAPSVLEQLARDQ